MKTNKLIILLAAMLLTGCTLGDTAPDKPDQGDVQPETAQIEDAVNYEAFYKPVLDDFFRLASGEYDENNIPEGGTALLEGNGWNESNAMLWDSGYMIDDLSGDGVPELLIGSAAGDEYDVTAGTMIYALFTAADGQIKLTLEGAYRNAYCILEDGSIFNQGSGGAG